MNDLQERVNEKVYELQDLMRGIKHLKSCVISYGSLKFYCSDTLVSIIDIDQPNIEKYAWNGVTDAWLTSVEKLGNILYNTGCYQKMIENCPIIDQIVFKK